MSVYQKPIATLADFPAFNVVELDKKNGATNLKAGDIVCLAPEYLNTYKVSSVVSGALEDGEDPIKAHERAVSNNHKTHYLIPLGASLTSHKREKKEYISIEIGDVIRFEGFLFIVMSEWNNNLGLEKTTIGEVQHG